MSILKADALQGKTAAGDIDVTSEGGAATMQLQQGLAKAWCNLLGFGTISVQGSFNTSAIVDNGTGYYKTSFTNNMSNGTYSVSVASHQEQAGVGSFAYPRSGTNTDADDGRDAMLTSSLTMQYLNGAEATRDQEVALTGILGDLA